MNIVVLLLGGNQGDRMLLIRKAVEMITGEIGIITRKSSVYESEPWGFDSPNAFYNIVVEVHTGLNPDNLLRRIQHIENRLGRKRQSQQYTDRTMDIDILFFNDMVIQQPHLTIPHPAIPERRFTLLPLAEILPGSIHPVLKMTNSEMLRNTTDNTFVKKLTYEGVSV